MGIGTISGMNPKPGDFEVYWQTAIKEMQCVNPQVVMKKTAFQAPAVQCCHMYFTGVNGARIHVKHLKPEKVQGKMPAVLQFHGYGCDSGDWFGKLGYVAAGMAVFAMDVRGQGGKSDDVSRVQGNTYHGQMIRGLEDEDPHKLLFRDIFLDTAKLADIVMGLDYIDETKVYTTGISQGGGLALACAALEPRIAKAAAVYPFLCDYKRACDMDTGTQAYGEIKEYFRYFDPRHERENEIFIKLGYIDLHHLVSRIKADVLMFTGLSDNVCPPSTQYAAYNKMTCKKRHIIYPDFEHEGLKDSDDMIFDFLLNN